MLSAFIAGGLVARFGPCRTGQASLVLAAAGCMAISIPTLAGMVLGSIAIGFSYGFLNPAASDLLQRFMPAGRRSLYFSIKQTGVPIGGVMVGLAGPPLALALGWAAVPWAVALACIALTLALEHQRRLLDAHVVKRRSFLHSAAEGFAALRRDRALFCLASSSFCFSALQLCAITSMVVLLVDELGFGLVEAGVVLAMVQVMGVIGRPLWGVVADRVRDGLGVLVVLAAVMALTCGMVVLVSPAWPGTAVVALFMLFGLTGVAWNGVYLSEVARLSPAEAVGSVTGTAMVFTFAGVIFAPPVFTLVQTSLDSYIGAYLLLVVLSLAGGTFAAIARRSAAATGAVVVD
ncbi:MAG: MFS transporter, partial [Roseovarius sp.]